MPTTCRVWSPANGVEGSEAYMRRWCSPDVMDTVLEQAQQPAEELRDQLSQLQSLLLSLPTEYVYIDTVAIPASNALTFPGSTVVTLPLALDVAEAMYNASAPSSLGVEGRGTVYDASLRKSREMLVGQEDSDGQQRLLSLSDQLASFDFPTARSEVLRRLCPTAAELEFRPYKLVTYAHGDFFAYHADSMSESTMVGSLALQIPIEGNDAYAGGELVFRSRSRDPGCPATADDKELRADLSTKVVTNRNDGQVTAAFAAWLGDVEHEVRPVGHPYRTVLLYRLYKRGDAPLQCGALLLSEMQRQLNAFFTDEGHQLPIHVTIENAYGDACDDAPNPSKGVFLCDPTTGALSEAVTADVSCIGILTQHRYPPAGLTPEALKGSDAVAYRAITATRECHLVTVRGIVKKPSPEYESEQLERGYVEEPRQLPVLRRMLATAGADDAAEPSNPYGEGNIEVIAAWTDMGRIEPVGEGRLVGNWDCDFEWWYRSAALVVLPRWSAWMRARWFFAAVHKGNAPGIERLLAVRDVFQHVLRFL